MDFISWTLHHTPISSFPCSILFYLLFLGLFSCLVIRTSQERLTERRNDDNIGWSCLPVKVSRLQRNDAHFLYLCVSVSLCLSLMRPTLIPTQYSRLCTIRTECRELLVCVAFSCILPRFVSIVALYLWD